METWNRRSVLRLAAGGGLAATLGTSLLGRGGEVFAADARPAQQTSYAFFTAAEVAWTDAAVARLIPADANGPGALQAGVTFFIDRQLAGPFGRASRWYMTGPWAKGTEQQGYQLHRTPAELYRAAIAAIDAHCASRFKGAVFARLRFAEQDRLLHALEKGELELAGVSGKDFFEMLWDNTKEGFFADPMYGGNRDFIGWKLIGFPGPRYNYVSEIRHFGQRYPLPPVGILGRDPSRRLVTT